MYEIGGIYKFGITVTEFSLLTMNGSYVHAYILMVIS